jgi:hypothetical protein
MKKVADTKSRILTDYGHERDEFESTDYKGGYEEIETEPLFNRSVHPRRVVIQHVAVLKCHKGRIQPMPVKKSMVNRVD